MSILSQKRGAATIPEAQPGKVLKVYADLCADPLYAACLEKKSDYVGLEREIKLLPGYDMMVAKYEAMYPVHTMGRANPFDVCLIFYQPNNDYYHAKNVVAALTAASFCKRHIKMMAGSTKNISVEIVKMISHISAMDLVAHDIDRVNAAGDAMVATMKAHE